MQEHENNNVAQQDEMIANKRSYSAPMLILLVDASIEGNVGSGGDQGPQGASAS